MTTNKPEVVAYLHTNLDNRGVSLHHDASCTSTLVNTEPLVPLSDYEALQAECGKLVEALDSILRGSKLDEFGNRDNDGINSAVWHGNTKDDLRRWQKVTSNALANYRKQRGK